MGSSFRMDKSGAICFWMSAGVAAGGRRPGRLLLHGGMLMLMGRFFFIVNGGHYPHDDAGYKSDGNRKKTIFLLHQWILCKKLI